MIKPQNVAISRQGMTIDRLTDQERIHAEKLRWLQTQYSREKLTDEKIKFFLRAFKDVPPDIFAAAANEAAETERIFPTVSVFRKYVDLERERRWRAEKKAENRSPISRPKLKGEHARETFSLIDRIVEKKLTGPISEQLWRMHERYPDAGWDEAARKQEAREKKR